MNLTSNDYKSIICARVDYLRMFLYPQYGQPQAVGAVVQDGVPDFANIKGTLAEIGELVEEFETSLGPA